MASPAVDFARNNQPRFLDELKTLLRITSISTLDEHKSDVQKAAEFVAAELRRIGMENVEIIPTKGHPLLYADWLHAEGKPTVLVYDHYDVQPPDPLDEWKTPPFEPTERDGLLFARGVSDNKGNLMARLQAVESYRATVGELPLRVRVLYEGEEEIGSEHLAEFVERNAERLRADGCIWEAGYKDAAGRPTVSLGLKGIAYFELRVRGAKPDADSSLATYIPNAAWRLVWALATLKNDRDEIVIDGLMEAV